MPNEEMKMMMINPAIPMPKQMQINGIKLELLNLQAEEGYALTFIQVQSTAASLHLASSRPRVHLAGLLRSVKASARSPGRGRA